MPRKPTVIHHSLPYHVVARSNNRERWPIPLVDLWEIFIRELMVLAWVYQVEIQSFVLMPNHFHLILTTPVHAINEAMHSLMKSVAQTVNSRSGRTGHFFEGPHKPTLIDSGLYYANAFKYVYRNPVKAGICERVEDYPFSTFAGLVGESPLPLPLSYARSESDLLWVPREPELLLKWLNQPHTNEQNHAIGKGLRRKKFRLPLIRNTRKRMIIEEAF